MTPEPCAPDPRRIADQLAIEARLRALESHIGAVRDPQAARRGKNILSRLEMLEAQVAAIKRETSDDT